MTDHDPRRRALLAGGLALGAWALAGPVLAEPSETVTVKAGDRDVDLVVWRPAKAEGVVVFSHGAGGAPVRYDDLFKAWSAAGFLVVAPVHVDSLSHPKHAEYDLRAAFPLRLADLNAAAAWSEKAAPGLPRAAAGHSYGSLMAMMRGGALERMVPARDAAAKAVVTFSTPGLIPGLTNPEAFATLNTPTLLLTGDKDVVPGFVSDWRDHLRPFQSAPAGGHIAWIGAGVDHRFGGAMGGEGADPGQTAAFAEARALSILFLRDHVLGDRKAAADLTAFSSKAGARIERR